MPSTQDALARVASGELRPLTAPSRRKKAPMRSTALPARLDPRTLPTATQPNARPDGDISTLQGKRTFLFCVLIFLVCHSLFSCNLGK